MHSLVLTDALHEDAPGGSRRVVKEVTEGLVARGHRVTVAVPRWHGDEPAYGERGGVRIHRYGHGRKGLRGLPELVAEGRRLLTALHHSADAPFDVLSVHFAYSHLPALLPWPLPLARVTVRSFYGPWAAEGLAEAGPRLSRQGIKGAFGAWARFTSRSAVERRSLAHADRVIALSAYSVEQLTRLYGLRHDAITLVPGGVDHRRFTPATTDRVTIRRRLDLPEDGLMVLTVRRLAARMGLDSLIAAMPRIRRDVREKIFLVIVGQGQFRAQLEAQALALGLDESIHFAGFVPDEDLPMYYQAADLFILPTRSLEGFGLITLEAFSCGLPVLGTPVGATPELLAQVDQRLILRGTNAEAIADGVVRYVTEADGQIPSEALRNLVLSKYTWETVVAQTEAVYEQALRGTASV